MHINIMCMDILGYFLLMPYFFCVIKVACCTFVFAYICIKMSIRHVIMECKAHKDIEKSYVAKYYSACSV